MREVKGAEKALKRRMLTFEVAFLFSPEIPHRASANPFKSKFAKKVG